MKKFWLSLNEQRFALVVALIYALVVTFLSCFHEVWRDEVVPMSVAVDSTSLADMFVRLRNLGHPGLWYVLLYGGYKIFHSFVILKVFNAAIAIAAIYIFLRYAPFSRWQRVLFVGGLLPLYIYPVINRDYSLSMLFIFLFCILYEQRFTRFVSLGLVLFLLANTHVHSLIMVMAIFGSLVLEFLFSAESRHRWLAWPADTVIGFGLIVLGIVGSFLSVRPDYTWNIVQPVVTMGTAVKGFVLAFAAPERAFPTIFVINSALFLKLATWALMIYLLRNAYIFAIFLFTLLGLELFFHLMFVTTALRHQAAFYLLLIIVLWLDRKEALRPLGLLRWPWLDAVYRFVVRYKEAAFTFILVLQVCAAYPEIKDDLLHDYSPAHRVARLLKEDPALKGAIVVPEPDVFAEALPYYADNPIYILREGRYEKATQFTTESRTHYSLAELLSDTQKLRRETGRPVVVLLGHRLSPEGPFQINFSWGTRKMFGYTPESLKEFQANTKKIAGFHDTLTDEEYDVFLVN